MDISVGDTFFAKYPENASHLFFIILDIPLSVKINSNPTVFVLKAEVVNISPDCFSKYIQHGKKHAFIINPGQPY